MTRARKLLEVVSKPRRQRKTVEPIDLEDLIALEKAVEDSENVDTDDVKLLRDLGKKLDQGRYSGPAFRGISVHPFSLSDLLDNEGFQQADTRKESAVQSWTSDVKVALRFTKGFAQTKQTRSFKNVDPFHVAFVLERDASQLRPVFHLSPEVYQELLARTKSQLASGDVDEEEWEEWKEALSYADEYSDEYEYFVPTKAGRHRFTLCKDVSYVRLAVTDPSIYTKEVYSSLIEKIKGMIRSPAGKKQFETKLNSQTGVTLACDSRGRLSIAKV